MSAITGIFYRDGRSVPFDQIKKMNDKLSHRGPDGSKVYCEESVALGHQILYTTQESLHESLPFEEDGLIITADARIDNRNDLSKKLKLQNVEHIPDSYFILKSYQKWGEKCPEELLGDFAFAIWDKNHGNLFCARDHMGVKPFYYFLSDELFCFATEMKALYAIPEITFKLNELKLAYYLMRSNTDKNITFYKDVLFLNKAHSLTINNDNDNLKKFWEIDPEYKIIMNSEEDYIQSFLNIFTEAVKCRLRSAFPIGFELSGGLDSSSVVCVAKKILKNNQNFNDIKTFSMIFNKFPDVDESYYIKKVIDTGGIKPCFIESSDINPLENILKVFKVQEQPFKTPNMAILRNMYKNMQDNDIRVLLGGGDEIISHGTNYLNELVAKKTWKTLIYELNAISKNTNRSLFKLIFMYLIIPIIPTYIKNLLKNYFLLVFHKNSYEDENILNKDFAMKFDEDYFKTLNYTSIKSILKTAREFHYWVINSHEEAWEMQDLNISSFYIEPRYPFLDKRLVEFCYGIPNNMKFKSGWNRYILRISMKNILPEEIQWRTLKNYFNSVLEKNLLLYEKKKLKELLNEKKSLINDYVNLDLLKIAYSNYISECANFREIDNLWIVILLHIWIKYNKILEYKTIINH